MNVAKTKEPVECVVTEYGESIAVNEIDYIAPPLRRLAVRIDSLKLDPNNARVHEESDLKPLAAMIKRSGMNSIIWFDPKTRIVRAGNGRLEAVGKYLKRDYIPAAPWYGTPEELDAYALTDNRSSELSRWDENRLAEAIKSVKQYEMGLDIKILSIEEMGFAETDLGEITRLQEFAGKSGKTAVEAKHHESEERTTYNLVIKCTSARMQARWMKAIEQANTAEFKKLCVGADVRKQE